MDTETKLLYSQLSRIRECIDTAEELDYTQHCTVHLWKVFYEYERQLWNKLPFTKGDQVEYEGSQWTVNFAQESYITLKHNVTGALPIVFPSDWGHIHPITK